MLKSANSPVSEDEPMEYTVHSSVTHNATAGLDTIIQSINKRYEVYQRRRTAMTPFGTPTDTSLGPPPNLRSILGDSSVANASSSAGGSGGSGNTAPKHASSIAMRDPLAASIVVANAHPAPYWEERELYIVAEDLCCYLNGGINYRLLCEQYQRALDVLLTLAKEDVTLCAAGAVEVVPGGTAHLMGKVQSLLKESRKLLEEAGVDVPPKLSAMLEQLPTTPDELPFSESPPAIHGPTSSALTSGNGSGGNGGGDGGGGARSPHARPPSALAPSRRQSTGNAVSANDDPLTGNDAPPRVASGGSRSASGSLRGRPPGPSRTRTGLSTPDAAHLPVHFSFAGNAGSGSGNVPGAAGTGTRRNTPSSAVIVDPPVDNGGQGNSFEAMSASADAPTQERHSSILRNSTTASLPPSAAPSPASAAKTRQEATATYVAHPPTDGAPASAGSGGSGSRPTPLNAFAQHLPDTTAAAAAATERDAARADDSAVGSISPIPSTPPTTMDDVDLAENNHNSDSSKQGDLHGSVEPKDVDAAEESPSQPRGRLRLLEELYGEHYALDGMTLLTDALGVVFTREYDQSHEQQYQNGFTAFQRDVTAKVTPALKSYEALQLRITELTPLRSAYLANCLARRVRPNGTVLDQLKRIDHDRTPEALLLGGLHLGDLGTAAVVESIVPRLYRLRTLNLSDNNVHDGVLDLLLHSLRYHPALETLDLSRNPITDSSLPFLLRIAQTVPRLASVALQSCGMTPKAKQMVETEVASPGTYAVATPPLRRPASSSLTRARVGSTSNSISATGISNLAAPAAAATVAIPAGLSSSSSPTPHPPTAHRPPSSLDGRGRWSPKASARAESMPTRMGSATRKVMIRQGGGTAAESTLPPLPHIPLSQQKK